MNGDVEFFRKVIKHPHVVIAGEEGYRNPGISELSQFALQPYKTFRDGVMVFKPEIENVAHQVYTVRFVFYRIQPTHNPALAHKAFFSIRNAQMEVGREEDFFAGMEGDGHW